MLGGYGPEGRNGKSVLVNVFQGLLGPDYATAAVPGLLRLKRGETHPTELADLFGRRFVTAIETGEGEQLNDALVKQLTGGDMVKARRMREDSWEFQPTHHPWIATNSLPGADATDRALWSGFRVIPFRRRFLMKGDEGYEGDNKICHADASLVGTILADEREGVFAWMPGDVVHEQHVVVGGEGLAQGGVHLQINELRPPEDLDTVLFG